MGLNICVVVQVCVCTTMLMCEWTLMNIYHLPSTPGQGNTRVIETHTTLTALFSATSVLC